jgi:predicted glycogen debranching enzyme
MVFKNLSDFDFATGLEWLETNGLGGYASGTVSGASSRRYHGLLVAAMNPPVDRQILLSKLEETIHVSGQVYHVSTNQYPGAIHPQGYQHLVKFERALFPEFLFQAGPILLKKTIAAVHGENTTLVLYEVIESAGPFTLEFVPLSSVRDYHSLSHANDYIYKDGLFMDGVFRTQHYHNCPELFISIPGSSYTPSPSWYYNFEYAMEASRGLDFREDLFSHGSFSITLRQGATLGVIISTEDPNGRDAFAMFSTERKRREQVQRRFEDRATQRLALAADQFLVRRGDDLKTIIAGYHWFSDWGRDTMIALPGITLVTGRFEDAKKILTAFAHSVSQGMLPNRFPDSGGIPEYNTVDATLWFFHAIYKYHQYAKDLAFIKEMLPTLLEIIDWHIRGTRYNIHVSDDGLLFAGEDGVQLTWMDAKVGDWVVTPRKGKPVEINALWYNALMIVAVLLEETGTPNNAGLYKARAAKALASFNEQFWSSSQNYLYDVVDDDYKNDDLRPNQIYALSLPFPLVPKEKATKVLDAIKQKLLTARGLRSLSPDFEEYKPRYEGDPWHRDGAYHQGTVWSHLLGAYIDALIKLHGSKGKKEASTLISNFLSHLDEGGVGTVSEIFNANEPHEHRGCIAQAWSVGEVLRVVIEHNLLDALEGQHPNSTSRR